MERFGSRKGLKRSNRNFHKQSRQTDAINDRASEALAEKFLPGEPRINDGRSKRRRASLYLPCDEDACIVEDQWIRRSFNVCIPVGVRSAGFNKNLIFRCPMPHNVVRPCVERRTP
jgi:hypothetical protein